MSNFNQVILMGNLTRDPKLSFTPSQTAVAEFGLAVNRKWKKADDTYGEEVCFVECQCFGRRAEVINEHFSKGSSIFVQGRLKFEQWEKGKTKHSRLRVIVENFEFIGRKQESQEEGSSAADDVPF